MKKRRAFLLLLVFAVIPILLWWIFRPPPQPLYEGRTLAYWLDKYPPASGAESERELMRIFAEAGTNALPPLLQMLRAHDNPYKLRLVSLTQRQHFFAVKYIPAPVQHSMAITAFRYVLPDARKYAQPALVEIIEKNISQSSQRAAIGVLGGMGTQNFDPRISLPVLLKTATSSDPTVRSDSVLVLGYVRDSSDSIMPVLVQSLKDPDPVVRMVAAQGLGSYGPMGTPAADALKQAVSDSDARVAEAAKRALQRIEPAGSARQP